MCEIARVVGVRRDSCRKTEDGPTTSGSSERRALPGATASPRSLKGGDVRYGDRQTAARRVRAVAVDIDLAICRHATTRGDRASVTCREAGGGRRNKFPVVKLVRAFGGCLGTKRR